MTNQVKSTLIRSITYINKCLMTDGISAEVRDTLHTLIETQLLDHNMYHGYTVDDYNHNGKMIYDIRQYSVHPQLTK